MSAPPYSSYAQVPWSTGLCDCTTDMGISCMSCCCPCIIFNRIADIVDRGETCILMNPGLIYTMLACVIGVPCLYSAPYRSKLRKEYNLKGSTSKDWIIHCCCEPNGLTQEYLELQNRGFDMKLGWKGNLEKQNHQVAMAPVVENDMKR